MTAPDNTSTADLLRQVTEQISTLVGQEVRNAQAEMADKARQAGRGAALLGGAGLCAAMAAGTGTAFVLRLFDRVLPPRAAALAAAAALGAGAAALAASGLAELRPVRPLFPERTVRSVQADVEVVQRAGQ
jgi:hypothetical protein